jgi:hypothetical protein
MLSPTLNYAQIREYLQVLFQPHIPLWQEMDGKIDHLSGQKQAQTWAPTLI